MSRPSYYLVNHTRKEFHYFENKQSIFKVLQESLAYPGWKETDDLHVESELSDSTALIEHLLNDLEYKDLQAVVEAGCIGCDESIQCGSNGYCAKCWNERYGCENEEYPQKGMCYCCMFPIEKGRDSDYCKVCYEELEECSERGYRYAAANY